MQYILALICIIVLMAVIIRFRVFFIMMAALGLAAAAVIKYNRATQPDSVGETETLKCNMLELLLCLFLGWAGAHKFYRKNKRMGILYLVTLGLFGIGWLGDLARICMMYFNSEESAELPTKRKVGAYVAAFFCVLVLGSCGSGNDADTRTIETTVPAVNTTEISINETTVPPSNTESAETTISMEATTAPTESVVPTETATEPVETENVGTSYVLNTNSRKFHYEWCSSAKKTKASNKRIFTGTRDEVISQGYDPCGRCHP